MHLPPAPFACLRFENLDSLTQLEELSALAGPVAELRREPMPAPGFSGSTLERMHVRLRTGENLRLVLKRVDLARAWTAFRTADSSGREARLLAEPALAAVWSAFACPYLAFASDGAQVGLLMRDLADDLLPDARTPLAYAQEGALLDALATLHARHWESPALDLPWLARPGQLLGMLGPRAAVEVASRQGPHPFFEKVAEGWTAALERLPDRIAALLTQAPEELSARYADLPRTLVHGDCKVANFAPLPDGRVAAFDWSCLAAGSPGLEVGWYLAVNASRLTGSKEGLLARYRGLLEGRLGARLADAPWSRTEELAILAGALMLLWSKALALEAGAPWARSEWDWWAERLGRLA